MAAKAIKTVAVAAVVAIAGYWYWSPFLTVRQLQSAAQKKDAEAFNEHVDYPKVRESIKSQYSARVANEVSKPADADNVFAEIGAAFGNMIGMAMLNPIVDALVRPETIMQAVQSGHLSIIVKQTPITPAQSAGNTDNRASAEANDYRPKWVYERKGVDTVIAYATDPEKPDAKNQEKFGLVLQRSGFANWKLTEVLLPALPK